MSERLFVFFSEQIQLYLDVCVDLQICVRLSPTYINFGISLHLTSKVPEVW